MRKTLLFVVIVAMLAWVGTGILFAQTSTTTPVTPPDWLFGVAGLMAVIIPLAVNWIKQLKFVGSTHAPLVAFILGGLLGAIASVAHLAPGLSFIQCVMAGIAIGGTSTGLYDYKQQLANLISSGTITQAKKPTPKT